LETTFNYLKFKSTSSEKGDRSMKKVLIAYVSRKGATKKMAEFIAEGIRFSGNTADIKKVVDIKKEQDLDGYDGFVFGCPTYHRDMTASMKTFLFIAEKANLTGKIGGAFASHTHSGESGPMIYDTMQHVFNMDMIDLGALSLKEQIITTPDGPKACQDYGRAVGEKIGA
jgi:NAD(P)H dehydrogenase (quinone)